MSSHHPHGESVPVFQFTNINDGLSVSCDTLEKMLLHPDVKDRKIVAVSIIGAFRRGKSFVLNYGLRFLYANVSIKLLNWLLK